MKVAVAVLLCAVLLLIALTIPIGAVDSADGPRRVARPCGVFRLPAERDLVIWYDDMEGGPGAWTHWDGSSSEPPRFHVDAYLACPPGQFSYWCGSVSSDYSSGDGYGNAWDQRLELPPIPIAGSAVEETSWGGIKATFLGKAAHQVMIERSRTSQPVLTFSYRYDSEPEYDFTWVQAKGGGTWHNLNNGYDGSSGGWQDLGQYGFDVTDYDDPLRLRFRFMSDGAWSDQDGLYDSDGGAFHVDNIRVFDFLSGEVYFFDDCEDGVGLCTPAVPEPAGDWWHIIDRKCPAFSDPHSWWCGDDADTSLIPPGLSNWLSTPLVDIRGVFSCTVHFTIHFAVPTVDDDYIAFYGTCNGTDYYSLGTWWGDFGLCYGWDCTACNIGFDITQFGTLPHSWGGMRFLFHTDDDGCGPGLGGDAGVMIDDMWFAIN